MTYVVHMPHAHVRRYDDVIWVHVMVIRWLILFKLHKNIILSVSRFMRINSSHKQRCNWLFKLFQTRKRLSTPSICRCRLCRFVSILVIVVVAGGVTPTPYGIQCEKNREQAKPTLSTDWVPIDHPSIRMKKCRLGRSHNSPFMCDKFQIFSVREKSSSNNSNIDSRALYSWWAKYGTESAFYIRY